MKYAKQVVRLLLRSTQELDETMKCYNLTNYFKPVATEEELVSYAVSGKTGAFVSSKALLIRWLSGARQETVGWDYAQETLTKLTWSTRNPVVVTKIVGRHSLNYPPSFLFHCLLRLVRSLVDLILNE